MRSTKKIKTKTTKPVTSDFRKLKLLVTVVNRNKTEFYMDFLSGFEVNFQTSVLAQGTAKSETLYMLGLEDSDKSVIFSVVREDKANEAMHALEDKFHTLKNGKGIAFTIPLSSVIGVAIYQFLSNSNATNRRG
jgi:nitrogen regulatory protein PII